MSDSPITVGWLWEICPENWHRASRGINHGNWHVHSVLNRPRNVPWSSSGYWDGLDAGPFVWSCAPSHDLNFKLIENPCSIYYTILVMQNRRDVLRLLELLEFQRTFH